MKITNTEENTIVNISKIYMDLLDSNRNVFIQSIDEEIFIYRSIARNEFKQIYLNDECNDMEKEEITCKTCLLYPKEYSFDECSAGIPSQLSKMILKSSYMDSIEAQSKLLNAYKYEMANLTTQMDCVIAEAYPNLDIEEIESWDIDQTLKYLSRAEWSLTNLRGIPIDPDYFSLKPVEKKPVTEEVTADNEDEIVNKEIKQEVKKKTSKQKLTPEKLAELKAKYPEIPWDDDSVLKGGVDALKVDVDPTPPALRPNF